MKKWKHRKRRKEKKYLKKKHDNCSVLKVFGCDKKQEKY